MKFDILFHLLEDTRRFGSILDLEAYFYEQLDVVTKKA